MFHITFVQIGVFDWLSGRQKASIFIKMFKNLLLRNHMEDEAETWYTCLGHYPLQTLCFNFGRIRTLVAMATYSSHRLIMGKVKICNFFLLNGDIWKKKLQKCLLSSPLYFIYFLSKSVYLIGCWGGKKCQFL